MLAMRDDFLGSSVLDMKAATNHELTCSLGVCRPIFLLLKPWPATLVKSTEILVYSQQGFPRPFTGTAVFILQLMETLTVLIIRNMVLVVQLIQSLKLINILFLLSIFYQLEPQATFLVRLSRTVEAATRPTVVFFTHLTLGFVKSSYHFFTSENRTIKILAKHLCRFILNFLFKLNHHHKRNSELVKDLTYFLRVTGVNEHKFRKISS